MSASYGLHRDTAVAPGWLRTLLPVLLLAPWHPALALGVGEPQLLSGYAEPLRVRVPLNLDSAGERAAAESIRAELIPASEYGRYGVAEQSIDVGGIYASSHASGASAWIEIGSRQAMREPAAILLLRVRLGSTLIVKEVPLLFDFNAPAPPVEEAPVAAAEPAVDAAAIPVAPAATSVAAAKPAPRKPRPAHHDKPATPAAAAPASAAASVPVYTLGPRVKYTSAVIGLRLAESFDSLAEWQSTHPQVQTPPPQPEAVRPPAAAQPRLPAPAPAVAPEAAEASRWVWISWSLTAAILAALWLLLRRKPVQPQVPMAAAPVPAAAPPAPDAEAAANDPALPIRERLRKLSRGKLDQDLARRALLVDAFLDLKRYDSAERLLLELEQELAAQPHPREGRADVAAAVRR